MMKRFSFAPLVFLLLIVFTSRQANAQYHIHTDYWPDGIHDCSSPNPHVHDDGHDGRCDNLGTGTGGPLERPSFPGSCTDETPGHADNLLCGPYSGPNNGDGCTFTVSRRCGGGSGFGQGVIQVGTSGGAYPHCYYDPYRGGGGYMYVCQHPSGIGQACECTSALAGGVWRCYDLDSPL